MSVISATELNKHPGQILQKAQKSPVIIQKTGQPAAVIVSYEYFVELEDFYFGRAAEKIDQDSQYLTTQESEKFLRDV